MGLNGADLNSFGFWRKKIKNMAEEILNKIQNILYPKIGKTVADSSIRINCQRIGIKPEELDRENIDIFAENIKISLILFLEEKDSEEIIKEIQKLKY